MISNAEYSNGLIWLIGGTQESGWIADELIKNEIACVVSVTTEEARNLYAASNWLRIWVGQLTADSITQFFDTTSDSGHCGRIPSVRDRNF